MRVDTVTDRIDNRPRSKSMKRQREHCADTIHTRCHLHWQDQVPPTHSTSCGFVVISGSTAAGFDGGAAQGKFNDGPGSSNDWGSRYSETKPPHNRVKLHSTTPKRGLQRTFHVRPRWWSSSCFPMSLVRWLRRFLFCDSAQGRNRVCCS